MTAVFKLGYPHAGFLSQGTHRGPLWKLFPGTYTHGNFQGPSEADGSHATAIGREDSVVLMDRPLSIWLKQALHLRVLGARTIEKKKEEKGHQFTG